MSHIVDAKTLAVKLRVKPATILAWARRGQIPSLRAARRPVLFDVEAVVRALSEGAKDRGWHRDGQ